MATPTPSELAKEAVAALEEMIRTTREADFLKQRHVMQRELDDLERQLMFLFSQNEVQKARISWLEADAKRVEADGGNATMRSLEGLLRAGAEAIDSQRRAETDKLRARVLLDDSMTAVTIDSLTFMREHLESEGLGTPNVRRALNAITRVVTPDTSVVELDLETKQVHTPAVPGTA